MTVERFVEIVVRPAQAKWGVGWGLLSDEQRLVQVQAQALIVIASQATIDMKCNGDPSTGRFVRRLLTAFDEWASP